MRPGDLQPRRKAVRVVEVRRRQRDGRDVRHVLRHAARAAHEDDGEEKKRPPLDLVVVGEGGRGHHAREALFHVLLHVERGRRDLVVLRAPVLEGLSQLRRRFGLRVRVELDRRRVDGAQQRLDVAVLVPTAGDANDRGRAVRVAAHHLGETEQKAVRRPHKHELLPRLDTIALELRELLVHGQQELVEVAPLAVLERKALEQAHLRDALPMALVLVVGLGVHARRPDGLVRPLLTNGLGRLLVADGAGIPMHARVLLGAFARRRRVPRVVVAPLAPELPLLADNGRRHVDGTMRRGGRAMLRPAFHICARLLLLLLLRARLRRPCLGHRALEL
mmetsp:Transcript_18723/g.64464  ORF Transcript_18723/g.64464 Transcript_18723/m.64464 type:complete len:334 (-) Transcript_18723:31-1032(-)